MSGQKSIPTILIEKLFNLNVEDYLVMLFTVMIVSLIVLFLMTRRLSLDSPKPAQQILELTYIAFERLLTDLIGKDGKKYVGAVGTFGVLIFLSNISGFIPGFFPPTSNLVVTLSLGISSFLLYNFIGLREGGFSYLKHFIGPMAAIGFLFAPVELVSHIFRPFSLGVRLFCNIYADHEVGHVFLTLVPIGVPIPFIFLGLFVSFMQTFVFVLLSSVYISMALPHGEDTH